MQRCTRLVSRSLVLLFLSLAGPAAVLADTVTITARPNPAIVGEGVIFTITPGLTGLKSGTLNFGDDTPAIVSIAYWAQDGKYFYPCSHPSSGPGRCISLQHVYREAGTYTVSFDATIGVAPSGTQVSGTLQLTVVSAIEGRGAFVPTAAHVTGQNNVNWRTDLEVQNPGPAQARYSILLLAQGQDNSNPMRAELTLDPGQSARYTDVLQTVFGFSGAGALCIVSTEGTVVAGSRTYAESGSGTFGSSVPALAGDDAIALGEDGRLIGLSHDPSLVQGFRTNVGLVNANEYPLTVGADFYLASGTLLGTASYDLQPFEFRQINRAFEQFTPDLVEDGYVVVRMASGAGGQILDATARLFAYASIIDNTTGDPAFISAITTAQPVGDISGDWIGTADQHAPDECPSHANASASFTQDGGNVTGTVSYGDYGEGCGHRYAFIGTLLGNALVGTMANGSITGAAKGALSGDSLEFAGGRFVLHLHR